MKKLGILVVCALLLSGCVSKTTKLSKSETLFTVNNFKATSEQVYEVLKQQDAGIGVIQHAQNILAKDVSDESVMAEAQEELESLKKALGDSFDAQLEAIGIQSEEQFLQERVLPELKIHVLVKTYVEEHYDTLFETHRPVEARVLEFTSEEKANEVQARIKAGETLADIAKELAVTGSPYDGSATIYFSTDTQLPLTLANYFTNIAGPAQSGILPDTTTQKYYIVDVIKTDFDGDKDAVLAAADESSSITDDVLGILFQNAGFRVYDKEVYDALQDRFAHYFKQK